MAMVMVSISTMATADAAANLLAHAAARAGRLLGDGGFAGNEETEAVAMVATAAPMVVETEMVAMQTAGTMAVPVADVAYLLAQAAVLLARAAVRAVAAGLTRVVSKAKRGGGDGGA